MIKNSKLVANRFPVDYLEKDKYIWEKIFFMPLCYKTS